MKQHIRLDMAVNLMLGNIPIKRNDPFYLINAILLVRKEKREIMEFYHLLNEEDKLLFKYELEAYNNAINNYNPNFL